MKKFLTTIIALVLSLSFVGCNAKSVAQEREITSTMDVTDLDKLWEFVNSNIYEISRDQFEHSFDITFLDVTGNGIEEAIIVNNADWSTNIEIVTVNGDKYENIKTDLKVAKYSNDFTMQDGFFKAVQATGGTGVSIEYMSLLVYEEAKMSTVLKDLRITSNESWPDGYREEKAQIKGPLTDFEYILTRYENGNECIVTHKYYTYKKDKLRFDVEIKEEETESC